MGSKVQRYYMELRVAWMGLVAGDDQKPMHEVLFRPKINRLFSAAAMEIAGHPLADKVLTAMEDARAAFVGLSGAAEEWDEQQRDNRLKAALDVLAGYQYVTTGEPPDDLQHRLDLAEHSMSKQQKPMFQKLRDMKPHSLSDIAGTKRYEDATKKMAQRIELKLLDSAELRLRLTINGSSLLLENAGRN